MTKNTVCALVGGMMVSCVGSAWGQSLYLQSEADMAQEAESGPEVLIEEVSLTFIPEPEARTYQPHDIITIIIDESSSTTSSQKLETEKDTSSKVTVNAMLDFLKLLELQVTTNPRLTNRTILDASAEREFTGEGDYERKDKFTARITATVLEVKPNGTLVLEATKRIEKDDEIQTLVIAGLARTEDITDQNTINSNQLANLSLAIENEGDLKKAAEKGVITRFFDTLFAF